MSRFKLIKAMALMSVGALFFAITGGLVKVVTHSLPFLFAVFGRSVIGFLMLYGYLRVKGIPIRAYNHKLLIFRSFLGFLGMSLFFFGIQEIPLSSAVILNFSSPIFVAIFSLLLLKERFRKSLPVFILLSFIGAGLIVSPDFHGINIAAILVFLSAITTGLAWVLVRRMSAKDSTATIVLFYMGYSSVFSFMVLSVLMIMGVHGYNFGATSAFTSKVVWSLVGVGIFATLGQILTTEAYSIERAAVVGTFSYLTPIISYFIGLIFFDETPKSLSLLGGVLILASSVAVVLSERSPASVEP